MDNGGGTNGSSKTFDLPLGHNLKGNNLVFLEEMDSQLGHGTSADDDINSGLSESNDELLEFVFFTLGVVQKLISILEEDSSLSLSLLHLNVSVEDNNLGVGGGFVGGLGSSDTEHTVNDLRVLNRSTENLLDTDVLTREARLSFGESVNGGSSDEVGEEVLKSELLGSNSGFDATGHLGLVTEVISRVAREAFDKLEAFVTGLLVSDEDLRRMESHLDETSGLTEELSRERDDEVSTVSGFILLHFGGLSDHLSGRMVDIRLLDDGTGIGGNEKSFEVVDDHLVHTMGTKS